MKTRIVDFDLEKAKAGAKVVTRDGHRVKAVYDIRRDEDILSIIEYEDEEVGSFNFEDGSYYGDGTKDGNDLFIEEQVEELSKEHVFKPFEKVLVRGSSNEFWKTDLSNERWKADLFSYLTGDKDYPYQCCNQMWKQMWKQCIPFEGNEHLLGTIENLNL